jgi:hypothetical protein
VNLDELTERLMRGGFVAADEEAQELMDAAAGDTARLEELVVRRETGEPLAWITGFVSFCGLQIVVHSDVYVPRWHTELVAERAAALLPPDGVAIDLCTGCGAVAATLAARRPGTSTRSSARSSTATFARSSTTTTTCAGSSSPHHLRLRKSDSLDAALARRLAFRFAARVARSKDIGEEEW